MALSALHLSEECSIDSDVIHGAWTRLHAALELSEQFNELITVDQVKGRRSIPGCLGFGVRREGPGGDEESFVPTASLWIGSGRRRLLKATSRLGQKRKALDH
jgi:hypothetical protein